MSFFVSPASANAPWAHSACNWNSDLSSALRVGCSKIPTILAFPLMLIGGWSSPWRLMYAAPIGYRPAPAVNPGLSVTGRRPDGPDLETSPSLTRHGPPRRL